MRVTIVNGLFAGAKGRLYSFVMGSGPSPFNDHCKAVIFLDPPTYQQHQHHHRAPRFITADLGDIMPDPPDRMA